MTEKAHARVRNERERSQLLAAGARRAILRAEGYTRRRCPRRALRAPPRDRAHSSARTASCVAAVVVTTEPGGMVPRGAEPLRRALSSLRSALTGRTSLRPEA